MFKKNKIITIYFLYLFVGIFIYSILLINEFPQRYVFTDWLINYEGGYIRRGLLGQIIYEISNLLNIQLQFILLFFEISIYFAYFLLFLHFFSKIKINFFWFLIIFSPIAFIYPLTELQALGRKEIFVITIFLIFVGINYRSLNESIYSFIILFGLSCLIHEIAFFYLFHYLFVIYMKNRFITFEKFKNIHYFLILLTMIVLIYLNLYLSNFSNLELIVGSYNYEIITTRAGAFVHISPSFDTVLLNTLNNITLHSITSYAFIFLINTIPFLFFVKMKKIENFKYFNSYSIFFVIILLFIPQYLLIIDWGRVIYTNFNFFIIILLLLFKLSLIDSVYLERKINILSKRFKIFVFVFVCLSFSPKLMVNTVSHGIPNDLSSFPLYRTILRISKGTIETLVELFSI